VRVYDAEVLAGPVHELGEGPVWDDATGTLSWVDIVAGRAFRGRLEDDQVVIAAAYDFADTVGAAAPTADGGLLVAAHDRMVVVAGDGTRTEGPPVVPAGTDMRLNDGGVDPAGRYLVGTLSMAGAEGRAVLVRIDDAGTATTLRDGLSLSNGIGWSPDGGTVYLVDSVPGVLWSAPYDVAAGASGRWDALPVDFVGTPDGLVVDAEGRIWVAQWGGHEVTCLAPTGETLARVAVPAAHVTCAAFVGPGRDRLLITTARNELDEAARLASPHAGRLFLADVGASGLPTRRWAGRAAAPGWDAAAGSTPDAAS
jgi:sugar lactone lactonase YvrE